MFVYGGKKFAETVPGEPLCICKNVSSIYVIIQYEHTLYYYYEYLLLLAGHRRRWFPKLLNINYLRNRIMLGGYRYCIPYYNINLIMFSKNIRVNIILYSSIIGRKYFWRCVIAAYTESDRFCRFKSNISCYDYIISII